MTDTHFLAGIERHKDLMREAEREREARMVMREEKRNNKTVAWMGHRLTNLGNHLIDISGESK